MAKAAPGSPGASSPPVPSASETVEVTARRRSQHRRCFGCPQRSSARDQQGQSGHAGDGRSRRVAKVCRAGDEDSLGWECRESAVARRCLQSAARCASAAQSALSSGALQRSLDHGATWQTSSARGPSVALFRRPWCGDLGRRQGGRALSTPPTGARTGPRFNASADGRSLSGDVTHIEARSATEIVLSISSGESWATLDGGKSWVKK